MIARAVRASLRAQNRRIETQHAQTVVNTTGLDFKPGDGTSTVCYVMNPFAGVLVSSFGAVTSSSHALVMGTKLFLRGVQLRFRLRNAVQGQSMLKIYMISAKQKSWTGTLGVTTWDKYISTTTDITNPTRAAGQSNIPLYETSLNGGFTGASSSSSFDTNDIKVLKVKKYFFNNYGVAANNDFKLIKVWFPINKFVKLEDPSEVQQTAPPVFFKWRQYYFVMQVFSGAATDIDSTQMLGIDANQMWMQPYWKNDQ